MTDLDEFTTVYKKAKEVLVADSFDQRWSNLEPKIKALLAGDAPDAGAASILDTVRASLEAAGRGQAIPARAIAEEIMAVSKSGANGFQDRAALIKLLKHFYYYTATGNQDVWVVDHPNAYTKWVFDEFDKQTADGVKARLQSEIEAFGPDRRRIMSDSLQLARKWSSDIVVKLGTPDPTTRAKVKKWFHGDGGGDADVNKSIATLLTGFKAISATCNSTNVIFSDHPPERTGGKYDLTFAEVSKVDKMPVIYIFPHFFMEAGINNRGQVGKMWLCALTVIHELSHKLAGTNDNSYDDLGLKPGGQHLKVADAIKTADSWGYFACDMVSALPDDALKAFYL